ncbi:MAG: TrmB family transcriptional regulator [Candidatus Heimdallarchaeota archaeon]
MNEIEYLEALGLTSYEAKAYNALVSTGAADARTISDKSRVPFGRIYDVLESLAGRGLVDIQESRPKRFLCVNPSEAIRKLLDSKNKELTGLTKMASEIEQKLTKRLFGVPKESIFWSVEIGKGCRESYLKKMQETNREILAYINIERSSILENEIKEYTGIVQQLIHKGIRVRLLIGYDDVEKTKKIISPLVNHLKFLDKLEVRFVSIPSDSFEVIDSEKVILKVRNPVRLNENLAAIFIWQTDLAKELERTFEEMWQKGTSNLGTGHTHGI